MHAGPFAAHADHTSKEARMTSGPDPRAALRGFMALVLDMVRVDPDRRPSAEMQRWHREIAAAFGVVPEYARTNRDLLDRALLLREAAFPDEEMDAVPDDGAPPAPPSAERPRGG